MSDLTDAAARPTTNGVIALRNLQAQITGLETQVGVGRRTPAQQADLIDLLLLRGQLLGCIADYECADALAEALVQAVPTSGLAYLSRARTHATFHRFAVALADLDAAAQLGVKPSMLADERAAIFQALGRYDEALVIRRNRVACRSDFATLGALAVLQAERGEVAEAEALFSAGRGRYQNVSPFPIALLDFQRGAMWLAQGDLPTARSWFDAARERVPDYAPAQGHLAEVEAALGDHQAAINRLRPLAACADDPEYAAQLAALLREEGQIQEAQQWRARAAARYAELIERHPSAFADHAAEFWLTVGGDADRAVHLARQNLTIRPTPRAQALLQCAVQASSRQSPNHPLPEFIG
ncbi:MAG: hypothetical protein DYG89_45230 [Caldilinea sp. CFX5]|nr:hypothetical protein [Caldilinea sp. CFX5]